MFPKWDTELFKYINSHHSNWLDTAMILCSNKYIWIPLYLFLIFKLFEKHQRASYKAIVYLILCVGIADQISSSIMKPIFQRVRPCHVPEFKSWINLADGCGGLYGFCSSHAANSFALACGYYLLTKDKWIGLFLLFWALMVCYSRVYLGAHFPLDVLTGGVIGSLGSFILKNYGYNLLIKKLGFES